MSHADDLVQSRLLVLRYILARGALRSNAHQLSPVTSFVGQRQFGPALAQLSPRRADLLRGEQIHNRGGCRPSLFERQGGFVLEQIDLGIVLEGGENHCW